MALELGLSISFNLTTGKFNLIDTTSSTGGSVYSKGVLKVTAPSGVDYYTTGNDSSTFADPSLATSPDFTAIGGTNNLLNIPTAGGLPQIGLYKFFYNAKDVATTLYSIELDLSYCHETPTGSLTFDYDCFASSFEVQDTTNYTVDTITPAITRSLTLTYPNGIVNRPYDSYPTPVNNISNANNITVTYNGSDGLFVGLYKSNLNSSLLYTYPAFKVIDQVAFQSSITTECSLTYCDLFCGIKSLEARYSAEKYKNTTLSEQLGESLQFAMTYFEMYYHAYKCGDTAKAQYYANEVTEITGATTDCGCGCGGGSEAGGTTVIIPFSDGIGTGGGSGAGSNLFSKTSFVDAVQGSNTTGVFGDITKKFATISKALTDSPSGFTIDVYSQNYAESSLSRAEAKIIQSGSAYVANTSGSLLVTDSGGALSNYMLDIDYLVSTGNKMIQLQNASSDVYIRCREMSHSALDSITVSNGAKLTIYADTITQNVLATLISVAGDSIVKIYAKKINAQSGIIVANANLTSNGLLELNVGEIRGSIATDNAQTGKVVVNGATIIQSANMDSSYKITNVTFNNCLIKNTGNFRALYLGTSSNVLNNSTVVAGASATESIFADGATNLLVVGTLNTNVNKTASVTILAGVYNQDEYYNALL
jgi:hypothetical protein